jgi:hypothetical protein
VQRGDFEFRVPSENKEYRTRGHEDAPPPSPAAMREDIKVPRKEGVTT